jgi:hypothetical protein
MTIGIAPSKASEPRGDLVEITVTVTGGRFDTNRIGQRRSTYDQRGTGSETRGVAILF